MDNFVEQIYGIDKKDLFELIKTSYFELQENEKFDYEIIYDGLKIRNINTNYEIIFNSYIDEKTLEVLSCVIFPIKDKHFIIASINGLSKENFNNDSFLFEAEKLFITLNSFSEEFAQKIYNSPEGKECGMHNYIIREVK